MPTPVKKILIIYPVDFKDEINKGIYDKMKGQGEAFVKLKYKVSYAYLEGNIGVILRNGKREIFTQSWSTITAKYFSFYYNLNSFCKSHQYDILYVRHLIHTYSLYSFLRTTHLTKTRIIYEYPTLPYVKEWNRPLHKFLLIEDGIIKKRIGKFIDLVVHYGGYQGTISSVQITNGIRVKPALKLNSSKSDIFRMIAVGRWEYWHGLDRVIKGIALSDQEIELNIVGDGPALSDYISLTNSLNLNQKIIFHGPLFDLELEELISKSHLGIGTLGLHRKRVILDSSLKHRMYSSYGLPFLFAGEDNNFDNNLAFIIKAKKSDEPIEIKTLITDYHSRKIDPKSIRNYAKTYLTWEKRMRKVLDKT